ncbi:MAG: lysostaphin resistance A-like protein [Burkholderiales bacterium]
MSAGAILAGALLAKPVHLLLGVLGSVEFHKTISAVTVICGLLASFVYLRVTGRVDLSAAGLAGESKEWKAHLPAAVIAGIALIVLLESCLLLLGVHELEQDQGITRYSIIHVLARALLAGLFVAFIEETLFRGALFSALERQGGTVAALVFSSALYAAAHYIKVPPVAGPIGWITGLAVVPASFYRFSDPAITDGFVSLFLLGILLGVMRLRCGNIIQCIGFHAGLVAALTLSGYLTDPVPGGRFEFLVNRYDPPLGWFSAGWLVLTLFAYQLFTLRRTSAG